MAAQGDKIILQWIIFTQIYSMMVFLQTTVCQCEKDILVITWVQSSVKDEGWYVSKISHKCLVSILVSSYSLIIMISIHNDITMKRF